MLLNTGRPPFRHRTSLSEVTDVASFCTPAKVDQRKIVLPGCWPERGNAREYCRDIEVPEA